MVLKLVYLEIHVSNLQELQDFWMEPCHEKIYIGTWNHAFKDFIWRSDDEVPHLRFLEILTLECAGNEYGWTLTRRIKSLALNIIQILENLFCFKIAKWANSK